MKKPQETHMLLYKQIMIQFENNDLSLLLKVYIELMLKKLVEE